MYFKAIFFIRLFGVLALLAAVMGEPVYGQDWGKVTPEEWSQGAPSNYPEANVVILFDLGTLKVELGSIRLQRHVRMKILNKAGVEEISSVDIPYYDEDRIFGLDAQTITPDGKKHEVAGKEIYTKSVKGVKVKSFSFPVLDSGCIVEYRYTNANSRYHLIDPWYFQNDQYTLLSQYTLTLAPGFTYSSATTSVPTANQRAEESGGVLSMKSYTWKMQNVLPVKDEPYMSFEKLFTATLYNQLVSYQDPDINYVYMKDWKDLGENRQQVINSFVNNEGEIKKLSDSLTAGLSGNTAKGKALYEYVINELQSLEDGSADYDKLSKVLKNRSGADADRNILLVELYKAARIPAWPVLIGTRDRTVFVPQLVQLQQFNHYIVCAQFDSLQNVFLDASSKYCPFGTLPPDSRSNGGLLIDGKKSRIVQIQWKDPNSVRTDYTRVHVGTDGQAICTTSVKFEGYLASKYGEWYEESKPEDFVKDYFLGKLGGSYTIDTTIFHHDSISLLTADISYDLKDYARQLDNNLIVKPVRFYFRDNPFTSERRLSPIDFGYPLTYRNMFVVDVQDSVVSETLPENLSFGIPGASYERICMWDGLHIIVNTRLSIETPLFKQASYKELKEFFAKVAGSGEDEIVFTTASRQE